MKIMYIHGFGSAFNSEHPKVKALVESLPEHLVEMDKPIEVVGLSIDYSVEDPVAKLINSEEIVGVDLIVGTSMGGWTASHVGSKLGIPWVAINPAVEPHETLKRYVNVDETDFAGRPIRLTEKHLDDAYSDEADFNYSGMLIVDKGDELFDWRVAARKAYNKMHIIKFEGGSHRFDHMEEALPYIAAHWNRSVAFGTDD